MGSTYMEFYRDIFLFRKKISYTLNLHDTDSMFVLHLSK